MSEPESIATIIAVYRNDQPGAFLSAIESVLNQALDRGRVHRVYLGIDGPLPEELQRAVESVSSRLHHIHRNPINQGLAATLNSLLKLLQDEAFVFRMDADDLSMPGRYQAQLDHMEAHPDVAILGTAILETHPGSDKPKVVRFARDHEHALAAIHRRVPVAHSTVCFRRGVFRAISGYPENGTNEDIALWFICLKHGFRFANLDQPYLVFIMGDGFWKRRGLGKAWGEMICYVQGIYGLHGFFTLRFAFPLLRLLIRLSPAWVSQMLYRSRWRR
jgi:glycosyltransferase involved in cell wall biosynthesis